MTPSRVPRWAEYLLAGRREAEEEAREAPPLRHGKRVLWVSDIAAQYFCEMKVELTYTLGRRETGVMKGGAAAHEEVLAMERVGPEDLVVGIMSGGRVIASFPVLKRVEGVFLKGAPDCAGFFAGKPSFLVELKTWGRSFRLYPTHVVQAQLYGLLMEEAGFDCSRLGLAVVGLERGKEREVGFSPLFRACGGPLQRGPRPLPPGRLPPSKLREMVEQGEACVYMFPYRREEALSALRWAKDYWTGRREPSRPADTRRCRFCEYREECADAEQRKIEEYA